MQKEALDKKISDIVDWTQTVFARDGVIQPRMLVISKAGRTTVFNLMALQGMSSGDIGMVGQVLVNLCRPFRHALAATVFIAEASKAAIPVDPEDREAMLDKLRRGELKDVPRTDCLAVVVEIPGSKSRVYSWTIVRTPENTNTLGTLDYTEADPTGHSEGRLAGLFDAKRDSDASVRIAKALDGMLMATRKPGVPTVVKGVRLMMARAMDHG